MVTDEKAVLSVAEVATLLGMSDRGIYAAVRRKELPFVRVGDRILFSKKAIDEFLRGNPVPASAQ